MNEDHKNDAVQIYRAAMKMSQLSYEELSSKLNEIGESQQPESLKNKVSRGNFSARFFFVSLSVMNINFSINRK